MFFTSFCSLLIQLLFAVVAGFLFIQNVNVSLGNNNVENLFKKCKPFVGSRIILMVCTDTIVIILNLEKKHVVCTGRFVCR